MSLRVFLIVSCLPSVLLMAYIYKKDRVEKEPKKLLLLLFVLGAAICLPVAFLESLLGDVYANVFGKNTIIYQLFENFLNVALFEEGFKFLVLFLVTRKSKHFNSLFDGIVYAVFVSLGFATLENVMYVFNYGLSTGLVRAVTAVPGHMFDGVIMGQFYGMWHLSRDISLTEKQYERMGYITVQNPESKYKIFLPLTLLVPILCHGMYDFLLSTEMTIAYILFLVYLIGLYVYCFKKINKLSKMDQHESGWILTELTRKYPGLYEKLQQQAAYAQAAYPNQYAQPMQQPYAQQNPYPNNLGQQAPNAAYPRQNPSVQNPYSHGMGQQAPNVPYQRQNPPVQNPYSHSMGQQAPNVPYQRQNPPVQNPYTHGMGQQAPNEAYPVQNPVTNPTGTPGQTPPAQNPNPNQTQPPMQ